MKSSFRQSFLSLCFMTLIIGSAISGYLYFFNSGVKADYYDRIARDLDESHPYGSREAIKYYNKAITTYTKAGDSSNAFEAYINLGLLHYKFGNMQQVEYNVLKALEVGDKNISEEMQAKVYLLLASTLEPEKAKEYVYKSLEISQSLHLNGLMAEAYFLLGQAYEYKAQFEDAEASYLKAVEAVDKFTNLDSFFDAAHLYERLGELYAGGGALDNAIKYYNEALMYSLREERGFVTANYMKIIGDLYGEKRNAVKACEMWKQSEEEYAYFGAAAPFDITENSLHIPCGNVG